MDKTQDIFKFLGHFQAAGSNEAGVESPLGKGAACRFVHVGREHLHSIKVEQILGRMIKTQN